MPYVRVPGPPFEAAIFDDDGTRLGALPCHKSPWALMVAMVSRWQREAGEIIRYRAEKVSDATGRRGRRVGVAYQLDSGEIIYVPEAP